MVVGSLSRSAGGLFESVRQRALGYVHAGHHVEVFGLADQFTEADIGAWDPLRPLVLPTLGGSAGGFSPKLGRALEAQRFDVIHQHGVWQAFSAAVSRIRRRKGTPVMISPHGMLDPWAVRNSAWKKRIASALYERENLAGAACIHALNAAEAAAVRTFGLKNQIAIVPNGTSLPPVGKRPAAASWWPPGRVLLFLGRIHPKKGIAELVAAFSQLRNYSPELASDWRLVVAGWDDGGHLAEIVALTESLGLSGHVVFPGALFGEEKDSAYANADAFILPSYSEGLPMTVLEAWSWAVPVFMTAACNLPDGFAARAAIEIETQPKRITSVLTEALAAEPAWLRGFGERGRRLVERRYLWNSIVDTHIDVYRWMIEGAAMKDRPPSVVDE